MPDHHMRTAEDTIADLKADLQEARERIGQLVNQNTTLRKQLDQRTLALLDADANTSIEQELRAEIQNLNDQLASYESLRVNRDELRGLWHAASAREYALADALRPLYRAAAWAATCTPDTLAQEIGDITGDLARAEQLLREHESR